MHGNLNRVTILATLIVASMQSASYGASITLTQPTTGQNYASGAGITYGGTGSWVVGTEIMTSAVSVDLVWYQGAVNGPGTIVESDTPTIDYTVNPDTLQYTGSYSFSNGTYSDGAQQGESTLRATPYLGNIQTYLIRATPLWKGTRPYFPQGGTQPVQATKQLGQIT